MGDNDEFVVCISPGSASAAYSVQATSRKGAEAYSSFGSDLPRLSDLAAQLAGGHSRCRSEP